MPDRRKQRRLWMRLAAGVAAILLTIGFVQFVRTMMSAENAPKRQVQVVQIIRPPPPPPPDQPPPPEKTEEALPKDQPEPTPQDDQPPPAEPLGLDAEGAAGADAFGLAARRGGGDLIGGNGGAIFGWYTNRLRDAIVEKLSADKQLGAKRFSVSVRVWIESDGRIREAKLTSTTGDRALDRRIETDLAALTRLDQTPPPEMPQPITLKIVSRT